MTTYLHTHLDKTGEWVGLVLKSVATIDASPAPLFIVEKARSQFPGIADLPRDFVHVPASTVAVEVPRQLSDWLESRGLTAEQVLTSFAHDLAETPDSNGSDERRLANEWFDRVVWPDDDKLRF